MATKPQLLSDDEVFGAAPSPAPASPTAPLLSDADVFGAASPTPEASKRFDPDLEQFVKQQEGYTRTPKWDFKQASVGYGTRYRRGDPDTPEFHQQRLNEELNGAADIVDRFQPNLPKGVRDGLIDLTFNAGDDWTRAGLGQAVRAGDYGTAAQHFTQYNKAGGSPLSGLANRRQALAGGFTQVAGAGTPGPGLLSDEEVFGTGRRQQGPSPVSNAAGPFPDTSTLSLGGVTQPEPVQPPPSVPGTPAPAEALEAAPSAPNPVTRGLVNTLIKQNPESLATTLEVLGRTQPNTAATVTPWAAKLREFAKLSPAEYEPQAKDFFSAVQGGVGDIGTFLGEGLGQIIGSAAPGIATGLVGAGVGAAAGSVVPVVGTAAGAAAGGVIGGLMSAAPQNLADAHDTLIKEGLDVAAADKAALWMTPALTALDYPMVGQVARAFTREAKKEVVRTMARRILAEGGKGMTKEGITEGMQEVIPIVAATQQTGKPLLTMEHASQVAGATVLGTIGGTVGGTISGLPRDTPTETPPTPDEMAAMHENIIGREPTPQPVAPTPTANPNQAEIDALQKESQAIIRGRAPEDMTPEETQRVRDIGRRAIELGANEPQGVALEDTFSAPPAGTVASGLPPPVVPTFYSNLRRVAQEKLPAAGTPEQIMATLRGRVKEEEIADAGLDEWVRAQGPKVTKEALLEHLYDKAIQLDETVYADAATIEPGERTPAQYQAYKTPGPVDAYRAIIMHMPDSGVEEQHIGPHYEEKNIIATARLTHRTDATGVPIVHVEEIQSDLHQEGAKKGYQGANKGALTAAQNQFDKVARQIRELWTSVPFGHRQDAHARSSWLLENSPEYNRLAVEHAHLADTIAREQNKVPALPFKKSWDDLAIKRLIRWAADKGISRITLAPGAEQIRRYPAMEEQRPENVQGLRNYYDRVLPNKMKEQIKRLGGTYGTTKINVGPPGPRYRIDRPDRLSLFSADRESADYTAAQTPGSVVVDLGVAAPTITQDAFYIDIPAAAATKVKTEGLPLYSEMGPGPTVDPKAKIIVAVKEELKNHTFFNAAVRGIQALVEVAKTLDLDTKVRFAIFAERGEPYGYITRETDPMGRRTIAVNLANHTSFTEIWSTLTHEFGHLVTWEKYANADQKTKAFIDAAFGKWKRDNQISRGMAWTDLIVARDSINGPRMPEAVRHKGLGRTVAETTDPEYWMGFDEFMAEQIARWASHDVVPRTILDRFFEGVSRLLVRIHEAAYEKLGMTFRPEPVIAEWMNSMVRSRVNLQEIASEWQEQTRRENQKLIDKDSPQVVAVPQQPETTPQRHMLDQLFKGNPPEQLKRDAAHADRFSWLYKWGLSLIQVAARNPHIRELQAYREDMQKMHIETQKIMSLAHYVLKQLHDLGRHQEEAVYGVMDDLDRMVYRTDKEKADGVSRNPTLDEFNALVRARKVSTQGLKALSNMRKMFDDFLSVNERATMDTARRTITDQVKLSEALDAIRANFDEMRRRPYFPHMQFGEHVLTIRNAAGKAIHVESFERRGILTAERVREDRIRELTPLLQNGETIQRGVWEKDARPMVGMPKALLDLMAEKLSLSETQRDQLEQLRLAAAPQQSFRHRFQRRKNIAGYSMDFRRAFATYFFHGAHFYAKAKYIDILRGHIQALKATTKQTDAAGALLYPDADNRLKIVNFLHDHLKNTLDVRSDWAALRAITFVWALGYSAAAAALNTTQLLVGTYPFLAAHFGDRKTVGAMTRAGAQLSTYYKKGTVAGMTDDDFRALDEAIKDGTITEAMAPQLAATAQGNNLFYGAGGNVLQRGWQHFMEKAAFMFEMTEQFNRRITFRAAWKLALENPRAKFIEDVVRRNPGKMARLTGPAHEGGLGWTEPNARAYIAAKEVTESTQYVYAQYARPRFMRGKLGTVFMFKMFVQNTLFMLWNYPNVAWRSLLVMGAMGGLMGLPGGDDVKEILRVIGWKIFGKDFNLEVEARRLILSMTDGKLPPDMVLHGLARRGMGIPAVLDMMGSTANMSTPEAALERFRTGKTDQPHVPAPIFDWSKSVGMGNILPIQLGELLGPPNKDQSKAIADQIQRASGAAFGLGFNLYKSITDTGLEATDPKRWERTMPRAFGAVSRAFRTGIEGRERTRTGATLQNYDVHDTEQLAELVGMGLGFQPLRSTAQWDRIIAEREAQEFWDISRGTLLQQFSKASRAQNQEDLDKVRGAIRKFNTDLPDSAKGKAITADTIKNSLRARQRTISAQESGVPVSKRAIGTARDIQELFPESTVDVRRVPR